MDTAVAATLSLFILGLAYHAGRLSVRVEHLETWRLEIRGDVNGIYAAVRRLEGLIKGEEV